MSRRVEGCVTGFFVVCWGGSLLIALLRTLPAALAPT